MRAFSLDSKPSELLNVGFPPPIAGIRSTGSAVVTTCMTFTELEIAALRSIFSETPELAAGLERQLAVASVTERENSGGGFFTSIAVGHDAPALGSPKVLGYETSARVSGLEDGLGFVLFMKQGKLHLLEGYAWGPESTAALDLSALKFEIYRQPMTRLG